jgi:hypothetical protein
MDSGQRPALSEAQCVRIVKRIVSKYRDGAMICSGSDFKILLHIFKLHPRFEEKTRGLEVKCFEIVKWGREGFTIYAILADGTRVDWSYKKACKSASATKGGLTREEVLRVFRETVEDQIEEFLRSREFGGKILADDGCLYGRDEVEVHHKGVPFRRLVEEFLALKRMKLEDVRTVDVGIGRDFADPQLRAEWREFHKRRARLAVLPKRKHIEIHSEERRGGRGR